MFYPQDMPFTTKLLQSGGEVIRDSRCLGRGPPADIIGRRSEALLDLDAQADILHLHYVLARNHLLHELLVIGLQTFPRHLVPA